jgi:RimJ/RimL family protein N-acetyltransferase
VTTSATARIVTTRLRLEPLAAEDADEMVEVLADGSLYQFIGGEPPSIDTLRKRYRVWAVGSPRPAETWHNWIIRLSETKQAIGHAQATLVDGGRRADIGWLIGTPWQGRGYAGEAARALADWLSTAGVATITAHVHPDHEASARVATKAGLEPTGELEDGEIVWRRVAGAAQ